ncbi:MAG TPA: hypothetical protein VF097_04850 [Actinomycetota bacterium]
MAVDERARHRLYNRVVEILGEEEAVILMAHLPPGGYPNFATKQDLLDLEERLGTRFEILEHRVRAHTLRVVLTTNLVSVGVLAGVAFAATGLT